MVPHARPNVWNVSYNLLLATSFETVLKISTNIQKMLVPNPSNGVGVGVDVGVGTRTTTVGADVNTAGGSVDVT
eukprot:CAMPEP_0194376162 /NCGR_PEP_ID=MMETSP0174-20130528/24637_1 /TAXON_ID=216777 /ORGANISM="Proboscia alata, Strain PI-D3" /LENGTH=73 /DNA_ID=CAMNT_0039156733 /DNA_START=342 /DNA_END=559 /DNA_ORIENTATION=+